ncbi:MAG TPA: Holliday junction branch migration DNA helicase RuvB [Flexilinea sp.]|nr:Holliday junction branch migration DNA helicase RuvB [Flexilinea sp.]HOR55762.1 Holliday junction branch migration DNA helicase RuvB [Flexilinea sp.]HPJ65664.1 Holliday junction branch migration DNA helicase RuvB [Flexilinea sp.]HPR69979.1 Holliday junction branch migration DNA helicase RuvB [Flexilinea sp.]
MGKKYLSVAKRHFSMASADIIIIMDKDRLINPGIISSDDRVDLALRPKRLNEIIGQDQIRENLSILLTAAKQRNEPLDHVLFYGPPGLGKTTLAHVLANEMGVSIKVTAGPAIERAGDLAAILSNLHEGDILFIDEIHRLNRAIEEILYPAMEDSVLDIMVGKGPSARSIRLKLPRFTVIGATTRLSLVSSPLRARFGAVYRLDYYDQPAMEKIIENAAVKMNVTVDDGGIKEIAVRSRGTPRIGLRLLRRVRDYAQVRADGTINEQVSRDALELMNIDVAGLDDVDRRVLLTIIEKYNGGPVGLSTIAASISEETDTVMEVVEPYLLQLGFIDRTPQGRNATRKAYEHLGIPYNDQNAPKQGSLFE